MAKPKRGDVQVTDLNQMQRYVGEEMIEMYRDGLLSRRRMLKRLVHICGGAAGAAALLAACEDDGGPLMDAGGSTPAGADAGANDGATGGGADAAGTDGGAGDAAAGDAAGAEAGGAGDGPLAKGVLSVPANDPDIDGAEVKYMSDTQMFAYLARPRAAGTYPGVVVVHENRGLNDHIRDVARRLAKKGYVALAPDLVSRKGGTSAVPADMVPGTLSMMLTVDELVKDLKAGVDFVATQPGVVADRYGVVGFCFGGGFTLRLAAAHPKILAAVSYYGPAPTPVDIMKTTNAAILGQYGKTDMRVNDTIGPMQMVLMEAGKTFVRKEYDGAGHAFNNDTGASYNEAAAVAAWSETISWFDKYLKLK
jgi:carboxymethylenebutenolidase